MSSIAVTPTAQSALSVSDSPSEGSDPVTEKAVRVSMDRRNVVNAVLSITLVLGLCSFAAGAPALYEVATWSRVPGTILPALFPAALDGSIIAFVAIRAIKRHRQESALWSGVAVAALTLISLSLQVLHVLGSVAEPTIQDYVGAGAAALYPALVWLLTEAVLDVITEPSPRRAAKRASRRRSAAQRSPQRPRNSGSTAATQAKSPVPPTGSTTGRGSSASRQRAADGASRRQSTRFDESTRAAAIQRVRAGESQRSVAEALGVSRGALQNWLRVEDQAV